MAGSPVIHAAYPALCDGGAVPAPGADGGRARIGAARARSVQRSSLRALAARANCGATAREPQPGRHRPCFAPGSAAALRRRHARRCRGRHNVSNHGTLPRSAAPLLPCASWRPSEPAARWPRRTAAVGRAGRRCAACRLPGLGEASQAPSLTDTPPRSQIDSAAAYDDHLASTPADKLLVVECSATWCVCAARARHGAMAYSRDSRHCLLLAAAAHCVLLREQVWPVQDVQARVRAVRAGVPGAGGVHDNHGRRQRRLQAPDDAHERQVRARLLLLPRRQGGVRLHRRQQDGCAQQPLLCPLPCFAPHADAPLRYTAFRNQLVAAGITL